MHDGLKNQACSPGVCCASQGDEACRGMCWARLPRCKKHQNSGWGGCKRGLVGYRCEGWLLLARGGCCPQETKLNRSKFNISFPWRERAFDFTHYRWKRCFIAALAVLVSGVAARQINPEPHRLLLSHFWSRGPLWRSGGGGQLLQVVSCRVSEEGWWGTVVAVTPYWTCQIPTTLLQLWVGEMPFHRDV